MQLGNMQPFVREHDEQPLSNAQIGKKFGYHPNYLNQQVLLHTGRTLRQYLIDCRVARAAVLLETSDLPIAQIAEITGMGTGSHFSKVMKSRTGISPRYYRQTK